MLVANYFGDFFNDLGGCGDLVIQREHLVLFLRKLKACLRKRCYPSLEVILTTDIVWYAKHPAALVLTKICFTGVGIPSVNRVLGII